MLIDLTNYSFFQTYFRRPQLYAFYRSLDDETIAISIKIVLYSVWTDCSIRVLLIIIATVVEETL